MLLERGGKVADGTVTQVAADILNGSVSILQPQLGVFHFDFRDVAANGCASFFRELNGQMASIDKIRIARPCVFAAAAANSPLKSILRHADKN